MSAELRVSVSGPVTGARVFLGDENGLGAHWNSAASTQSFEAGRAKGREETLQKLGALVEQALADLASQREQASLRLAQDAALLAVEIARELTRSEIRAGRHDIERIVRESLTLSGAGRGEARVHVHPSDAARLSQIPFRVNTTIEADPALREGDVHVTCAQGVLVREIDEALSSLRERLSRELCP